VCDCRLLVFVTRAVTIQPAAKTVQRRTHDARRFISRRHAVSHPRPNGERVSALGLGGWHLGLSHVDEALSIRIVREAIDRGITFLDNSWDYNDGASEIRMGRALKDGYRQRAFVMTKIDGRSKAEAAR